jgi:hypothetical protein
MIGDKVRLTLFSLGAIVLLCIGTTGIIVVQAAAGIQKLADGVISKKIFERKF